MVEQKFKLVTLHIPGSTHTTHMAVPIEDTAHLQGGDGSGNFGHEGRPGEVGGSGEGGGFDGELGVGTGDEAFKSVHEIGEVSGGGASTTITSKSVKTEIRGGGAVGADAEVLKIAKETDGGLTYSKMKAESNTSKSGRSGTVSYTLEGDGHYLYSGVSMTSSDTARGIFTVKGSELKVYQKKDGVSAVEQLFKSAKYVRGPYSEKIRGMAKNDYGFKYDGEGKQWINPNK